MYIKRLGLSVKVRFNPPIRYKVMVPNKKEHSFPAVYLITCKVNGKIYVGGAKDFYHRWERYRSLAVRENRLIARAIRKHGFDQFEFSIIERVGRVEDVEAREQHYIDTLCPFSPIGYNVSPTAMSSRGVKHTPEAKANMTRGCIGRVGRPVVQIDIHTNTVVAEYPSVSAAARAVNVVGPHIDDVCRGKDVTAAGYQWCFKEAYDPASYRVRQRKPRGGPRGTAAKPVLQLDLDGRELRVWDHASAAAKKLGIHPDTIRAVCHGRNKTARGYRWAFVTDEAIIAEVNARHKQEWKERDAVTSR